MENILFDSQSKEETFSQLQKIQLLLRRESFLKEICK